MQSLQLSENSGLLISLFVFRQFLTHSCPSFSFPACDNILTQALLQVSRAFKTKFCPSPDSQIDLSLVEHLKVGIWVVNFGDILGLSVGIAIEVGGGFMVGFLEGMFICVVVGDCDGVLVDGIEGLFVGS